MDFFRNGITDRSQYLTILARRRDTRSTSMAGAPGTGDCCFSAPVVTFTPPVVLGQTVDQYIGRGIMGQPKLYVTDQPIRNFLRFLRP